MAAEARHRQRRKGARMRRRAIEVAKMYFRKG